MGLRGQIESLESMKIVTQYDLSSRKRGSQAPDPTSQIGCMANEGGLGFTLHHTIMEPEKGPAKATVVLKSRLFGVSY